MRIIERLSFQSRVAVIRCSKYTGSWWQSNWHYKDHSAQWLRGHNVPGMLTELNDAGLTAVAVELGTELQAQHCTDRYGQCSQPRSCKYPDLRYLRHESDFGTGHSTDAGLQKLLDAVQQVIKQLPQAGVSI